MKKIKKILSIIVLTTTMISMVGCDTIKKSPEALANTIVAKIGNEKIKISDIDNQLKTNIDALKEQHGEDFESKISDSVKEELAVARISVLENMIEEKMLLKKAEELNLIPSDEEMASKIDLKKTELQDYYGGEEGLLQAMEDLGYTEESLNTFIKTSIIQETMVLHMTKDIIISEEEAKEFYDKNQSKYTKGIGGNVKHILFRTDLRTDESVDGEMKELAEELKSNIDSGKETFDKAFEEYKSNSIQEDDIIAENLSFVQHEEPNFDQGFLDGFKILKDGEISAPVKSSFGYHIIQVTDLTSEESITPFDDAKDEIIAELQYEKQYEAYTNQLIEWEKELKIKTYMNRIPTYKEMNKNAEENTEK